MAAAARAYRNVQQWGAAVSLLETVVAREPANAELQLALVMTLADAGQDQKALPLAKQLLQIAELVRQSAETRHGGRDLPSHGAAER